MGTPEGHKEEKRDTQREKWREGRKERGQEMRREMTAGEGRGLVMTLCEHPACHPQRNSILGVSELLTLRILQQWKPRRLKSENQRTVES